MAENKDTVYQTREYTNEGGMIKKAAEEKVAGTDGGKDLPRNFEGRGLRKSTPFPNIVRIEQLDFDARSRYSSGLINTIDKLHSFAEEGRVGGIRNEVFYGFLKSQPDSQKIDIRWKQRGGMGEIVSAGAKIASGVTGVIGKIIPAVGAIGEGVTSVATGAFDMISNAADIGAELAGINTHVVGANTIKRVEGVGINQFSVSCSWYLPEQYALFCKGIRSLFRIAYPNEVDLGTAWSSKNIKETLKSKAKGDTGGPEQNDIVEEAGGAIDLALNKIQLAGTKIGMTFSVDPSPVRVSIGQSWDLEPLVITGLTIKPSKETFIEPTTHAHLPITMEVQIGLDYWLTPRAGQENMSIAGQEIFGWLQEDRYVDVIKNTEKYVNEKNKNMWDLLKPENLNSTPGNRRGMNM